MFAGSAVGRATPDKDAVHIAKVTVRCTGLPRSLWASLPLEILLPYADDSDASINNDDF